MKVTTSCSGRFHIYDQARQLSRFGALHYLVSDYPKSITRRWNIPDDKAIALVMNGVLGRLARHLPAWTGPQVRAGVYKQLHNMFSRRLARHVPPDADVFIGLSSFCLEALQEAREFNQLAIVDHGSFHQRVERELLQEEQRLHGVNAAAELAHDWIIEKEDAEFHLADHVFVLSQAAKHSLTLQGISSAKIFVNPCGVDLSSFKPLPRPDAVFRVVYCGNLSARKGVHYLLQAFTELQLPNTELLLIGSAPSPAYEKLIGRFRTSSVRFLGSFPQHELSRLYAQGSVFVLPSIADGFGMVVPQAMACGLPAIVTHNVGAADIISDGVDGYVVPIRDVAALKLRLRRLYEQPLLREQMASAARHKVAGLSWDAYGERLVTELKSYLAPTLKRKNA